MNRLSAETLDEAALGRIRRLASMSDEAFAETCLAGLSAGELEEFLEECPDFPINLLPKREK